MSWGLEELTKVDLWEEQEEFNELTQSQHPTVREALNSWRTDRAPGSRGPQVRGSHHTWGETFIWKCLSTANNSFTGATGLSKYVLLMSFLKDCSLKQPIVSF